MPGTDSAQVAAVKSNTRWTTWCATGEILRCLSRFDRGGPENRGREEGWGGQLGRVGTNRLGEFQLRRGAGEGESWSGGRGDCGWGGEKFRGVVRTIVNWSRRVMSELAENTPRRGP